MGIDRISNMTDIPIKWPFVVYRHIEGSSRIKFPNFKSKKISRRELGVIIPNVVYRKQQYWKKSKESSINRDAAYIWLRILLPSQK